MVTHRRNASSRQAGQFVPCGRRGGALHLRQEEAEVRMPLQGFAEELEHRPLREVILPLKPDRPNNKKYYIYESTNQNQATAPAAERKEEGQARY